MSQKDGGRDPEAYERIFIKQGDRPVELVIPYEMREEEIFDLLDAQFETLMNCEKDLLQVMNDEQFR